MNLVLIGMRGSGKTTVGGLLAQSLGWPVVETDKMIEDRLGLPVAGIVKKHGWRRFRAAEREIVKGLTKMDKTIISTGGGVILNKSNIRNLKKNGVLIFLTAGTRTLLKRTESDPNRPFLTRAKNRREDIEKTLKVRKSLYQNAAHLTVFTESNPPERIVEKIIKYLKIND